MSEPPIKYHSFKYTLESLSLPKIPAGETIELQVVLNGAKLGDTGRASSVSGDVMEGITINPVRITGLNTGLLSFTNETKTDIEPQELFNFIVELLKPAGVSIAPPGA